ncbi:sarcosine oxidase subunit alpha [Natribacillus halophilus]|uniref:Sarcosine oxidase subunit alpha n=1 Tax=Natribacillus halophilus TaxID=549003 RepID=A0A1G8P355_9BACI|nr:sarcosine oxidase subunit alpha [Natribacillus halophilus]
MSAYKEKVNFSFNDVRLEAKEGQTVAAALYENDYKKLGTTRKYQRPRGLFCATGRCYSCLLTVNDQNNVLSCMTLVEEGMSVKSNQS